MAWVDAAVPKNQLGGPLWVNVWESYYFLDCIKTRFVVLIIDPVRLRYF